MALSDWNEKRLLALTGGVAGAILAIMAGLDVYIYMEYDEREKDVATLNKAVDALEDRVATREGKEKDLKEAKAASREAELQLPDGEEEGSLVTQVSEQIKDFKGLSMTKIGRAAKGRGARKAGGGSAGAGAPAQSYVPVKMEMEASGEFHHFGQFLNRIENRLERIVAVKGFEITANKDGLLPKSPNVTLKLKFEAYRYNVPQGKKAK